MDEDGNPPSLLDTEEELKSDELEELGEEEEMAEAQRCARKRPSGWARYGKRIYLYVSQRRQWVDAEVTRLLEQLQKKQQQLTI